MKKTLSFLIIGILMSFSLWRADRVFPLCPISDIIPQFPVGLDGAVVIVLLVLLILGMIFRIRMIFVTIVMVMLLLLLRKSIVLGWMSFDLGH